MACVTYDKCSIRFVPDRDPQKEQNYSDRSTVELRQIDFADYSLQGIDVDNNKKVRTVNSLRVTISILVPLFIEYF